MPPGQGHARAVLWRPAVSPDPPSLCIVFALFQRLVGFHRRCRLDHKRMLAAGPHRGFLSYVVLANKRERLSEFRAGRRVDNAHVDPQQRVGELSDTVNT